MKKITFWNLFVILFIPIILLILYINGKINEDKFFKAKINSQITSKSTWAVKATYFYMDNGLSIDSSAFNEFDIQLGDSIVKDANSWYFKVFKKNLIGHYDYYKTYKIR